MLRTSRINFRKNWACQPSLWNKFLDNLKADIEDLNDEISDQTFPFTDFNTSCETILGVVGKDKRVQAPNL